jgi:hypothetical protein
MEVKIDFVISDFYNHRLRRRFPDRYMDIWSGEEDEDEIAIGDKALILDGCSWDALASGAECYVFDSVDRPDVILKVYKSFSDLNVVSQIRQAQILAHEWEIGPEVLSEIITIHNTCNPVFGYISEKATAMKFLKDEIDWDKRNHVKVELTKRVDAVFDINWWDNHNANIGRRTDGSWCVIDFGLGLVKDSRVRYARRS